MNVKWRTPPPERKPVTVTRPDGSTFETSTETTFAPVPVPPKDWDLISTRIAVGMVLVLTLVAVAWSTWSIGALLHGGIGYLAAVVFDLSWGTALILEWKSRYDADKRMFPLVLGWGLLAVTMGAIFWHAWPDMRYAVVGAVVSGVAKILWLGIMKHIEVVLKKQDADDLADRRSKAAVGMAFASVDRQVMRTNAHTAAVRLSLEQGKPVQVAYEADTDESDREALESALRSRLDVGPERETVTHAVSPASHELEAMSHKISLLSQVVEQMAERADSAPAHDAGQVPSHRDETSTQAVSLMSHESETSTHSGETDTQKLVRALRSGRNLSAQGAADLLGVSRATGGRRLAEARAAFSVMTDGYN